MRKKIVFICILAWLINANCVGHKRVATSSAVSDSYKSFLLSPLPDWTNKWSQFEKGDRNFFKLSLLVKEKNLTRLQAVELQNHFRDLTEKGVDSQNAFEKALMKVAAFDFESKLNPDYLSKVPFIIVIDIDETLLQQYYKKWRDGPDFYDYKIHFSSGTRGVSLAPNWKVLFTKIKQLGGGIVIFSANTDSTVWDIVNTITIDGKRLSDFVDGIMSNNYLVLQGKSEWTSGAMLGNPVVIPSKDLRFLDESLDKVIILDDNPIRIIQHNRLRLTKKYQADVYLGSSSEAIQKAFRDQLLCVAEEIEESYKYCKKHKISFSLAFLPYTQLGQVAVDWLKRTKAMTNKEAISYIRNNPDIVDKKF
jgi:hypothetical protein